MATLKGQNFRICIFDTTASKYKVIGMATGCTVNLQNNVDEGTHKDIVGAAAMPTTTSKSWSVSCDSLNVADAAAMAMKRICFFIFYSVFSIFLNERTYTGYVPYATNNSYFKI